MQSLTRSVTGLIIHLIWFDFLGWWSFLAYKKHISIHGGDESIGIRVPFSASLMKKNWHTVKIDRYFKNFWKMLFDTFPFSFLSPITLNAWYLVAVLAMLVTAAMVHLVPSWPPPGTRLRSRHPNLRLPSPCNPRQLFMSQQFCREFFILFSKLTNNMVYF